MTDTKSQLEQEVDLLKTVFKDNEALLKLLRSLFFGFSLSNADKDAIKAAFSSPALREAIRNKMYPLISRDVPIGTEQDFWGGMENQIFGRDKDSIYQAVKSKQIVLDMFTKAFHLLEDPYGESMDLSYDPATLTLDPLQIKLLARNLYLKTISVGLATIKIIAEQKDKETPQETAKRLNADSTK